jgi:hypothetical protein
MLHIVLRPIEGVVRSDDIHIPASWIRTAWSEQVRALCKKLQIIA